MRIFEKISFYSDLELIPFSQKLEKLMSLPPFELRKIGSVYTKPNRSATGRYL